MRKPKVEAQEVTENYAIYNTDCIEGMAGIPDQSIHLTCYSPPFTGMYVYSSDPQDLSNCQDYEEFFEHYEFQVKEIHRIMIPGRITAVHVCDVPGNAVSFKDPERARITRDANVDFPGDVIRLHEKLGFKYHARFAIWKEPLRVAIRTRSKGLNHGQLCKDTSFINNAGADYLLLFRKEGQSAVPIAKPLGLKDYIGEREVPESFQCADGKIRPRSAFENWEDPKTNKLAHWIFQQYASSFWDDIRISRVLKYKEAREPDDEKHCHPLQLDVIERCVQMWSNPGETVLTPFMGVGSEVAGAVMHGRKGIGFELKASYFRQAVKNIRMAMLPKIKQEDLFSLGSSEVDEVEELEEA